MNKKSNGWGELGTITVDRRKRGIHPYPITEPTESVECITMTLDTLIRLLDEILPDDTNKGSGQ